MRLIDVSTNISHGKKTQCIDSLCDFLMRLSHTFSRLPSRVIKTYPTFGKGKSSTQECRLGWDMLVFWRVTSSLQLAATSATKKISEAHLLGLGDSQQQSYQIAYWPGISILSDSTCLKTRSDGWVLPERGKPRLLAYKMLKDHGNSGTLAK